MNIVGGDMERGPPKSPPRVRIFSRDSLAPLGHVTPRFEARRNDRAARLRLLKAQNNFLNKLLLIKKYLNEKLKKYKESKNKDSCKRIYWEILL